MSNILVEEEVQYPFILPELESTEVEKILRAKPEIAKKFIERMAKGEIGWEDFNPHERGLLLHGAVESSYKTQDEISVIKSLREADWLRTPPTIEEFLEDPKYLGVQMSAGLYKPWKEDLKFVLDPKNEIYSWVLSGGIGVGKCVYKNEFIFSTQGMLTIEELYANKHNKNEVLSEVGIKAVEEYHDEGHTQTIKLNTKRGFSLEARPNHRIRVLENNNIVWKETKDINLNDNVIISRKGNVWGNNPYNISELEAELFGVITGDGCIRKNAVSITFGNTNDDLLYLNSIIENILKPLDIKYSNRQYNKNRKYITNRLALLKSYVSILNKYNIKGRSWEKKVPLCIRQGSKKIVGSFIRGIFDTDGTVYARGNAIEFTTCSTDLSKEIQLLLLNFGINSSRIFKTNDKRGAWTVRIIGRESKEIFSKEIGFRHPKKALRLKNLIEKEINVGKHNDHEIIPIDWQIVSRIRDSVRGQKLNLKNNRDMFICVKTKGKQKFTYKALDKIVECFGIEYLPNLLKQIYTERYIYEPIVSKEESFNHCYDLTVQDNPSYISSGFISHNTKIAIIAQLYKLAVLTCLKNINEYLGLDNATQISFGLFSLSLDKVEGALSEDFKKLISDSPYFKNVFPLKKARTAKRVLNNQSTFGAAGMAEYEVLLPQNLRILLGSKISHALSLAVVSAILDEMNFRGKRTLSEEDDVDSAENLYNQIRYRITSRFERLGFLPGLLCVISSRTSTSGFIEAHIAKIDGGLSSRTGSWIAKNDPHCFISSYSQWDVKPDNYSKEKFHVFIGSSKTSSRILTEEEYKTFPENSPSLLAVPVSARPHFENDINAALRELAGISSSPTHLLFEDPVIVKNVWNMDRPHPFKEEIIPIGLKTHLPISAYLKEEEIFYDAGFSLTPKHHPDMLRVIHIDLSKNKDLTGITMAGVSSLKEYRGRNLVGETITNAITPQIFVDFSIGLKAPQGDQIDYEKIQQFISFLRKMGFNIFLVTFDQFASTGPMQMLVKDGFTVDNLSVDRTDTPYRFLRDVVSKKNIDIPYSKALEREMLNLLYIHGDGRSKVDHPKMTPDGHVGSKDLCDALTGAVANCVAILTNTKKYPYTANANIAGRLLIGDNNLVKEIGPSQVDSRSSNENHDIESFVNSVDPFKHLKG